MSRESWPQPAEGSIVTWGTVDLPEFSQRPKRVAATYLGGVGRIETALTDADARTGHEPPAS